MRCSKFVHITPVLRELHWLPVSERIAFKTAVLGYKCLHGLAPSYLINRIVPKTITLDRQRLRSDDLNLLIVPRSEIIVGSNNFSIIGPTIWNSLPPTLRQPDLSFAVFRKELKTFLYNEKFLRQLSWHI